ncbi:hypothetical protein TIFTF001_033918 [Ficus carica]|uniref:Uncharacterized protein n=1 Tax=Ficus carica TaxID=3494 RepID=A0AA88DZL6_FICCA|nr:hypothetical protein TIFTF001_033918 [Ficus carica]
MRIVCRTRSRETSNHRWEIATSVSPLRLEICSRSHIAIDARSKVQYWPNKEDESGS